MLSACIAVTLFVSVACALAQADSQDLKPVETTGFLKRFTVDSFSYSRLPEKTDYPFPRLKSATPHFRIESFGTPSAAVETYNPNGLECPVCAIGPPNRTRYSAPPFSAKATFSFWRDRVQLFASFGGIEAWKPDGLLQSVGNQKVSGFGVNPALKLRRGDLSPQWGGSNLLTNDQYNDQWLTQSHVGVRFFLDREKNISFGVSKGYMYNASPFGTPSWTSTTGDLTITFGNGPSEFIGRVLRRHFGVGRRNSRAR